MDDSRLRGRLLGGLSAVGDRDAKVASPNDRGRSRRWGGYTEQPRRRCRWRGQSDRAPFQHFQPERYAARAEVRKGAAVLVAPSAFLDSHKEDAAKFHGCMRIEDIVEWLHRDAEPLEAKRRRWRAALLCELIKPPLRGVAIDDEPTMDFTAFCVEWLTSAQFAGEPSERSLHSAGQGWLWFKSPRGLGYKASGWARKDKAAVDLYLGDHGFTGDLAALERLLERTPPPADFVPATDTARKPNVVLRYWCDKVSPAAGKPEEGSAREASSSRRSRRASAQPNGYLRTVPGSATTKRTRRTRRRTSRPRPGYLELPRGRAT